MTLTKSMYSQKSIWGVVVKFIVVLAMLAVSLMRGYAEEPQYSEKTWYNGRYSATLGELAGRRLYVYGLIDSAGDSAGTESDTDVDVHSNQIMNRLELAEILYRLFGSPEGISECHFIDVPVEYESAVSWLFDTGLLKGISTESFGTGIITRIQLLTVFSRLMGEDGKPVVEEHWGSSDFEENLELFAQEMGLLPVGISDHDFQNGDVYLMLLALLEQYYPDKCEVIRPQMGRPNQVVLSVSSLEEAEEQIQSCANYAPESISVSFDEESTIEDLLGFEEKYAVHEDKPGAELRFASMMNTGNTFCYSLSHDSERTFVLRFLSYSVGYLAYLDMQTWLRCFSDEAFSQRIQEFWTVNILPLQGAEKDDYTKAREAMQLLCDNASYDWEERDSIVNGQGSFRPEAHSLSGFLSSGKIVCDGYAKAYQWILKCMGIDCLLVYGKSMPSEEGHAWNKVKIGENWFNADVCWRDTGSGDMYFLKSDDFFQNNWHQYRDTYVLTSFASLSSYSLW